MARPASTFADDPADDREALLVRAAHELLGDLEPAVVRELLERPEAFRETARRTLEYDGPLPVGVVEPSLSIEEGRRRLEAARVPRVAPTTPTVGASELVRRLEVSSRQTLYDRVARGELVGFDLAGKMRFPIDQFDGRGRVLPGIREVLAALSELGDAWAAWRWMTRANAALDDRTPLERLQDDDPGRVADVMVAAAAERDGAYR